MKFFTPSLLVAMDDYLLRHNFLLACLNSYVKDGDPGTNPYISPAFISDEVLRRQRIIILGFAEISADPISGLWTRSIS